MTNVTFKEDARWCSNRQAIVVTIDMNGVARSCIISLEFLSDTYKANSPDECMAHFHANTKSIATIAASKLQTTGEDGEIAICTGDATNP